MGWLDKTIFHPFNPIICIFHFLSVPLSLQLLRIRAGAEHRPFTGVLRVTHAGAGQGRAEQGIVLQCIAWAFWDRLDRIRLAWQPTLWNLWCVGAKVERERGFAFDGIRLAGYCLNTAAYSPPQISVKMGNVFDTFVVQ